MQQIIVIYLSINTFQNTLKDIKIFINLSCVPRKLFDKIFHNITGISQQLRMAYNNNSSLNNFISYANSYKIVAKNRPSI